MTEEMQLQAATPVPLDSDVPLPSILDTLDANTLRAYVESRNAEMLRQEIALLTSNPDAVQAILAAHKKAKRSPRDEDQDQNDPIDFDPLEATDYDIPEADTVEMTLDAAHLAQFDALPLHGNTKLLKALYASIPDIPIYDLSTIPEQEKNLPVTYLQLKSLAENAWVGDVPPDQARTAKQRGRDEVLWIEELQQNFVAKLRRMQQGESQYSGLV